MRRRPPSQNTIKVARLKWKRRGGGPSGWGSGVVMAVLLATASLQFA